MKTDIGWSAGKRELLKPCDFSVSFAMPIDWELGTNYRRIFKNLEGRFMLQVVETGVSAPRSLLITFARLDTTGLKLNYYFC